MALPSNPSPVARFLAVLCLLGLSACLQTGMDPAAKSPGAEAAQSNAFETAAANGAGGKGADMQTASLPKKPEPPKKALPTLHDMIGLDRDQITALLGNPRFRRLDTPADLWQYGNEECAIDLYLYRIRDGSAFKVTHVEMRPMNGAKISQEVCFENLIKQYTATRSG